MRQVRRIFAGRSLSMGLLLVVGLAFIVVPLVADLGNYVLTVLVSFLIYVALSESWNLMGGYAGQVNLGMAAYFGTGALCYILVYVAGVPFYLALVAGGLGATVVACVIGPPTLRLRGAYFGIGTMAVAEVLRLVMTTTFTLQIYSPASHWASYSLTNSYYIALAVAVATIAAVYMVMRSRLGLGLQAIRDDEDAANAAGINPARYKMIVFIISSFLAGVAGGAFSYFRGTIDVASQFRMDWTIGAIVSVTIGGWGTLAGPILGSVVFVVLREILGRTVPTAYLIVTGIVFVLVIMFLPDGLVSLGDEIGKLRASRTRRIERALSKEAETL